MNDAQCLDSEWTSNRQYQWRSAMALMMLLFIHPERSHYGQCNARREQRLGNLAANGEINIAALRMAKRKQKQHLGNDQRSPA